SLLVECVRTEVGAEYYLHTPLHQPGNEALARVTAWRLWRDHALVGVPLAANLGFMISLRGTKELPPERWRDLLAAAGFAEDLTALLKDGPAVRARFGQVATIG